MAKTLNKKELSDLLDTVRRAGYAEGYAQAKMDMALDEAGDAPVEEEASPMRQKAVEPVTTATGAPNDHVYKTRTTVNTTKTIALDYIKNASPRVVGPTEIKKNSERALNIHISFGTLKRATDALVAEGEIEQVEDSRWRYKSVGLRSVK